MIEKCPVTVSYNELGGGYRPSGCHRGRIVRRLIVLSLVLLAPLFSLGSAALTWSWNLHDEDISLYRYQLNSEDDEGWTTVDSTVTSVSLESDSESDTLFVQASRDGIIWSESGYATFVRENEEVIPVIEPEETEEAVSSEAESQNAAGQPEEPVSEAEQITERSEVPAEETAVTEDPPAEPVPDNASFSTFSVRLDVTPYTLTLWSFVNGRDIEGARSLTSSVYGFSTSLEFDWTMGNIFRIYPEAEYALALRRGTVVPSAGTVHYVKLGGGFDFTFDITQKNSIYIGASLGCMFHICNKKANAALCWGTRLGWEYELTEHLALSAGTEASFSYLKAGNSLNDSLTVLILPVSISLTYLM